jgi:hypothetical protein
VYVDVTAGTVAAGNWKVGITVGGAEVVAATSYENSKAVGTSTAGTIVDGSVAANVAVYVRHTGVARPPWDRRTWSATTSTSKPRNWPKATPRIATTS